MVGKSKPSAQLLGLLDARQALLNGEVSATSLTRDALRRGVSCKEECGGFARVSERSALAAAAESEERYDEGRQRPLEGLPIAIKDLIDTQGIETCYGSKAYIGNTPATDARIVAALRNQGAIIIGKTTTHEFAWGVTTASTTFGDTLNPLNTLHIPGGSSGGAAAAIAFGAVAAGVGTDTGGSVRIPAALCGVVGYKPSYRLLPSEGIFALAPSLDHPGLLGKNVSDVILLASALGISQSVGPTTPTVRLGVISHIPPVPLSEDVSHEFTRAIAKLNRIYAQEQINPTGLFNGAFEAFAGIVLAEGGMAHFGRRAWDSITANYELETVQRLTRASEVRLADYMRSQSSRREFCSRLAEAMSGVDFLMLPTTPCVAPLVGQTEIQIGSWRGSIREALMTYTAPFNLAGLPAISIPLPPAPGALPSALQIVGHAGDDVRLLSFAATVANLIK
ncbi:amidase [Pseudomonas abietaniphila]